MIKRRKKRRCYPIFSDEDAELRNYYWGMDTKGYARRSVDDRGCYLFAHRDVMQRVIGRVLLPSELIDHKNGKPLDCRRTNLRITDHVGNMQNRIVRPGTSGGVRGVCWNKASKKWQANVHTSKKTYYLGLHDSIEEAGRAAAAKRKELGFLEREDYE